MTQRGARGWIHARHAALRRGGAMDRPAECVRRDAAVLHQSGADLAARDNDGDTPLHEAAMFNDDPTVLETLLAAGADPTARNAAGETPWDLAQANEALQGTDGYWRLNDARFDAPRPDSRP